MSTAKTRQKLIVVVGPTASGKTDLAINIAKKYRGEVISADSRQVYKKLDIGTAKVTEKEMKGVPHHLIDVVDIDTVYTAANFKRDAKKAIREIAERGRIPIVAGGTFFYTDTLLGRIATPRAKPNPELRAKLEKLSADKLFKELEKKDPRRAADIDPKNKRRLVRSLEIIDSLGEVPSPKSRAVYDMLMLGIHTDKDTLREKLQKRAETWLQSGFLEEVQSLLDDKVSRNRLAEIGFEYQIGLDILDGKLTPEKFTDVFVQKNWQYAKRQLTWLKRDHTINWVSPSDKREVDLLVKQFLMTV